MEEIVGVINALSDTADVAINDEMVVGDEVGC
jgi:hypothetical protein